MLDNLSTIEIIFLIMSFLIPLGLLIIPKGMLIVNMCKYILEIKDLGLKDIFLCYCPLINNYTSTLILDGDKSAKKPLYFNLVLLVLATIIIALRFVPSQTEIMLKIQIINTMVMILIIIAVYVQEIAFCLKLTYMLNCTVYRVLILLPFICEYFLINAVAPRMKAVGTVVKGTFDEKEV